MHAYRIGLLALVLTLSTTGRSVLGQAQSDSPTQSHKIGELAWLAGRWQGAMPNGWFEEYWTEPRAGMMTGMFRMIGPDGKTVVLEFEQIIETPAGIELRFKRFSSDLEPREESKQPMTLRLERLDAETAVFVDPTPDQPKENQPHRIVLRRKGDDQYTSEVYVLREGKEQRIFTSHARRARAPEQVALDSPSIQVTAGCGSCIFGMEGVSGCPLAVKIEGKPYLVTGVEMDALGDAHAPDGLCNMARQATTAGRVEGDRFVAERMELLPQ